MEVHFCRQTKTLNYCDFFIINIIIIIRECGNIFYVGLQNVVPPTIQNSRRFFSRLKQVYLTQTLISTEHHISSLHSHFCVKRSGGSPLLARFLHALWTKSYIYFPVVIRAFVTLIISIEVFILPPTRMSPCSSRNGMRAVRLLPFGKSELISHL